MTRRIEEATPLLLMGGGIDSTALFLRMRKKGLEFNCMHADYGQEAYAAEEEFIERLCRKHSVVLRRLGYESTIANLNPNNPMLLGEIDARNLILVLKALRVTNTVYLGLDVVYTPGTTPFSDCSVEYLAALNTILAMSFPSRNTAPTVLAPLLESGMTKLEACKEAYAYDNEFFELSMTCHHPINTPNGWRECGLSTCKHCRIKAEIRAEVVNEKSNIS